MKIKINLECSKNEVPTSSSYCKYNIFIIILCILLSYTFIILHKFTYIVYGTRSKLALDENSAN